MSSSTTTSLIPSGSSLHTVITDILARLRAIESYLREDGVHSQVQEDLSEEESDIQEDFPLKKAKLQRHEG